MSTEDLRLDSTDALLLDGDQPDTLHESSFNSNNEFTEETAGDISTILDTSMNVR